VVYDTELVTLMHDRYYLILKLVISYFAAYHLPFVLGINTTRHIFYSIFSIYRTQFKLSGSTYDTMITIIVLHFFCQNVQERNLLCIVVQCTPMHACIVTYHNSSLS
jgi:hypothetical protein